MLQFYPAYLLCNRGKTLTGSPDPTRANGTNKPCKFFFISEWIKHCSFDGSYGYIEFNICLLWRTGVELSETLVGYLR